MARHVDDARARRPGSGLPYTDTDGALVSRDDRAGAAGLLVMFLCNHCPYVQHIREGLAEFARGYRSKGLAIVAINANDAAASPDDGPEKMKVEKARYGYVFPYLYDEPQAVAKAYAAACTPDFFLFDSARRLVYRGQFDDSRPGNGVAVTGKDLRAACDALLSGRQIPADQRPSIGCNIKWRAGNAPTYFGAQA